MRALRFVLEMALNLLDGFVDAIQNWQMADELHNGEDENDS